MSECKHAFVHCAKVGKIILLKNCQKCRYAFIFEGVHRCGYKGKTMVKVMDKEAARLRAKETK